MSYDSTKPTTDGSLVSADIRENFRALKEDGIVVATDASITQVKLKTSQGSVNVTGTQANIALPGGEYGFYPQTKSSHVGHTAEVLASIAGADGTGASTSYITNIFLGNEYVGATGYAQQRYVTSSGEVFWVFILRDKLTKDIRAMYQAPDHPCFGNGGKPSIVQHPFGGYDSDKYAIVVINPTEKEVTEMKAQTEVGDSEYTMQDLLEDYVQDDTEFSFEYPEYYEDSEDAVVAMARKNIVALYTEKKISIDTKFWRSFPDKDLLEIIAEEYEIDEVSKPAWPSIPVTVGLPKDYETKAMGAEVITIKKVIPRPDYVGCKSLKRKVINIETK